MTGRDVGKIKKKSTTTINSDLRFGGVSMRKELKIGSIYPSCVQLFTDKQKENNYPENNIPGVECSQVLETSHLSFYKKRGDVIGPKLMTTTVK